MHHSRPAIGLLLALVLGFGAALRTIRLAEYDPSPDEGNYLQSARLLGMARDSSFSAALADDRAWLSKPATYPHSYVHQLVIRWAVRGGLNYLASVRVASAVLGTLTILAAWWLLRSPPFSLPRAALPAAAFVALGTVHVWYSRTGWGQIGCTFFWLLWFAVGARILMDAEIGRRTARLVLWALGMCAAGLLAFGYHEMIVVYVAALGTATLVHARVEGGSLVGAGRWLARSPRTWALLLAAAPIVYLAWRIQQSAFAQELWFSMRRANLRGGYWEQKRLILEDLFTRSRVHEQFGILALALALVGFFTLWRERPHVGRLVLIHFLVPVVLFVFFFQDGFLVRIYLPLFVLAYLLAGIGLTEACTRLAARWGSLAAGAFAVAVLLHAAFVTRQTVFGEAGASFAVTSFYDGGAPVRGNLTPIVEWLRANRRAGELLGISDDYTPLFVLADEGIPSRFFAGAGDWQQPPEQRPHLVLGVRRLMQKQGRTIDSGGNYEPLVESANGRFALYRNAAR